MFPLAALTFGWFLHAAFEPDAVVVRFPARPIPSFRDRVQKVLRGEALPASLARSVSLGIGRSRLGLIAVEEATTALDATSFEDLARIRKVMRFAFRMLDGADLSEADRRSLRSHLDLHLAAWTHRRPRAAIMILSAQHLWDARHLDFFISHVADFYLRPLIYPALRELVPHLTAEQIHELRARLRALPRKSLDARCLLDEFGALPDVEYGDFIDQLRARASGTTSAIRAQALARVGSRLQAGDLRTRLALRPPSRHAFARTLREEFLSVGPAAPTDCADKLESR